MLLETSLLYLCNSEDLQVVFLRRKVLSMIPYFWIILLRLLSLFLDLFLEVQFSKPPHLMEDGMKSGKTQRANLTPATLLHY